MSITSYSKHPKSRRPKYVVTTLDGNQYTGNTQKEATDKMPKKIVVEENE